MELSHGLSGSRDLPAQHWTDWIRTLPRFQKVIVVSTQLPWAALALFLFYNYCVHFRDEMPRGKGTNWLRASCVAVVSPHVRCLLLTHQQQLSFQSLHFLTGQMGLINTSEDCDLDSREISKISKHTESSPWMSAAPIVFVLNTIDSRGPPL